MSAHRNHGPESRRGADWAMVVERRAESSEHSRIGGALMDHVDIPGLVRPGERAPPFALPGVAEDGQISLDDYRTKTPLFLILLRSFECPFCRRQLTRLKETAAAFDALGIETLVVTTTPVKAARLYAKYRPPGIPVASDPDLITHRAYGVPIYRLSADEATRWPERLNTGDLSTLLLNPTADLPESLSILEAGRALEDADGFTAVETEEQGPPDDVSPLVSFFLIDRAGIVRWLFIEALENPADYGSYPNHQELLAAARAMMS